MSEKDGTREGIFREEALRRHLAAREFGDVLRLPPRWTRVAYPLVVGAAIAGLVLLCVYRVEQTARGPAVVRVDERSHATLLALLPASFLGELRPGMPLRAEIADAPRAELAIDLVWKRAIDPAEARSLIGPAASEVPIPGPVVLASARLPGDGYRDGTVAAVSARVRSERLIFALFPKLRQALAG